MSSILKGIGKDTETNDVTESYWGGPSPAQLRFNRALERERKKSQPDREKFQKELDRIIPPTKKPEDDTEKQVTEKTSPEIFNRPKNAPIFSTKPEKIGNYIFDASEFEGSMVYGKDAKGLVVKAYDPKTMDIIGSASFVLVRKKGKNGDSWLESDDTKVQEKYRGKGIATAMYQYAKNLGNDIKPSPYKSTAGGEMWKAWGRDVFEDGSSPISGTTGLGYTWRFEAGREVPWKSDVAANTFVRVTDPAGKTVAGVWADLAGDSLVVEYSQVFDDELRGRGLYTDLLKSLSKQYAVTSDTDTNNAAASIYKRLGADYDAGQARHTLRKQGVAEGKLNFEEGDCPIFAIALHRLSKMPLMALVEYDEQMGSTVLIHAYVKLDERWRLDASGETDVNWMLQKYPNNGNAEEIEISEKNLLELGYGKSKCPTLQQVLPHAKEVLQNIEEGQQGVAEGIEQSIPPILYHATYKPRLKNIKLKGLGAGGKRNWEDSKRGVVYLALDPYVAESYAETSDMVPDEWLDQIVILEISTAGLDPNKFQIDSNVQDNEGDTIEYHGVIPLKNISLYKQGVEEAVVPDQKLQSSVLYHGTPTKAGYQGISSQGLKIDPELIAQKYKGQENFAPLPGVYMTKEFGNAVRYSFMSNVPDEQYAEYIKQEPNGYVFEFSGKDLTTVTPDEDELGSLLIQLVNNKNLQPNLLKIVQAVPEELRIKLQQPRVDFETIAIAGKWLVNRISDSTIQYLMKRYHNVVNYGGIKPSAVWVIPKPNERFLRDRQGTFNTHNGYVNYAKRFGKKYNLTEAKKSIAEGTNVDVGGIKLNVAIDGSEVIIRPIVDGYQAGYAVFDRDGSTLVPADLAIDEEFRGQSIAKTMYDYVKSLGFTIRRSSDQTKAGKHFWDKNRGEDSQVWEQTMTLEELDEACWKGYHKEGNKKMFGKTYPNCVKNTNEDHQECPECGGPMFSEEMINEKKDACYYKVKSRYKVWPSAYASGALVQCRKKGASNWGTKSESSILEGIEQTDENLHKWFKEKWVRFGPDGKIRGACARGDDSEGKPKCLPQSKAQNLGKKGRASAAARKRREDPNPERHGKAINVATKKKTNESSILQGISETKGLPMPGSYEQEYGPFKKKGGYRIMTITSEQEELKEKWSDKYKRSIDCSHPKGFSQRAHCQGRKKK